MKPKTENRKPKTAQGLTNSQKGLIHVAKAQLMKAGVLTEESYRAALVNFGGVATSPPSSKDLTPAGMKSLMRHFERCGFKQLYKPRGDEAHRDADHRLEACATGAPDIRSLPWEKQGGMALIGATLGKLDKPWVYARGIAKRMSGSERLEWCSKEELQNVLTALVYQQRKTAGGTPAPRGRGRRGQEAANGT